MFAVSRSSKEFILSKKKSPNWTTATSNSRRQNLYLKAKGKYLFINFSQRNCFEWEKMSLFSSSKLPTRACYYKFRMQLCLIFNDIKTSQKSRGKIPFNFRDPLESHFTIRYLIFIAQARVWEGSNWAFCSLNPIVIIVSLVVV